jgi:trehalose 6-phosphate phosphatase
MALISGRRLGDLDNFLAPLTLPAAAEHGAQRRRAGGEVIGVAPPDLTAVMAAAQSLSAGHAGLRVEAKSSSIALHYRHAPALEGLCLEVMHAAASRTSGVEVLRGKCVVEVKPMGVNKGRAIAAFMAEAPFAGRVPLFAGDDTTDEAGFLLVQSQGGQGLKVGDGPTAALHRCGSPAQLRAWLASGLSEAPEPAARSSHGLGQGAA